MNPSGPTIRRCAILLALLMCLPAIAWAAEPEKDSKATLKIDLARKVHREGDYPLAVPTYEEFINTYPDDPRLPQALFRFLKACQLHH